MAAIDYELDRLATAYRNEIRSLMAEKAEDTGGIDLRLEKIDTIKEVGRWLHAAFDRKPKRG